METWDLYDDQRQLTGRLQNRDSTTPWPMEHFHLVAKIALFSGNGSLLIQQRTSTKSGWPNYWDLSAGGSVLAGETSWQGAKRECYEELGLLLPQTPRQPQLTITSGQAYNDFYILKTDFDQLSELTLQKTEVQQIRWATFEEVKQLVAVGCFIPYPDPLLSILFEIGQNPNALWVFG